MTYPKYTSRAVCLLALLPMMLAAQRAPENTVPLKNWASPLYWQPSQTESQARGVLLPQIPPPPTAEASFLTFVAITPCRLVDTRGAAAGFTGGVSPFNGLSLGPNTTTTFPVQSSTEATGPDANTGPAACGVIPSIAEAYSLNVTVIPHAGAVDNYVTLWPAESAQPVVSTVNDPQGVIVANAAIVAAGEKGAVSLYNSGPATVDVVIDMNGYFAAPTDLNGNTAVGAGTLTGDTSGYGNVAIGSEALTSNTSGGYNVAAGVYALASNTSGTNNTASGQSALAGNTQGNFNTAYGNGAMQYNTLGTNNTGIGNLALEYDTAGYNTAVGDSALTATTTGTDNTALGASALIANAGGGGNIALGYSAGSNAPAANSNSIYIGSTGGVNDLSGGIQIGNQAVQTGGTSIAGIYGGSPNPIANLTVCVDANGVLGTSGCLGGAPVSGVVGSVATGSAHDEPALLKQLQTQAEQIRTQAEQSRKLEDRLRAVETLLSVAPPTK